MLFVEGHTSKWRAVMVWGGERCLRWGRSNPVRQKQSGVGPGLSCLASPRLGAAGVGIFHVLCISHLELSEHACRVVAAVVAAHMGLQWTWPDLLAWWLHRIVDLSVLQGFYWLTVHGGDSLFHVLMKKPKRKALLEEVWNQSAPSEEVLPTWDCLVMTYLEHLDLLKETTGLFPGESSDLVRSLSVIWMRDVTNSSAWRGKLSKAIKSLFISSSCLQLSTNTSTGTGGRNARLCKQLFSQLNHLKERALWRVGSCKLERTEQPTAGWKQSGMTWRLFSWLWSETKVQTVIS